MQAAEQSSKLEETFRQLADTWYDETGDSSSIRRRIMHRAYQEIIGLGPAALPLLLHELKREPDYWFWALACITRENPVRPNASFEQAVDDWLAWGQARGLIDERAEPREA